MVFETVYQFSPRSSGSTMMVQILRSIFPNVVKTHRLVRTSDPIVIAYRHPLGNFASHCRRKSKVRDYSNQLFIPRNLGSAMVIFRSIRDTKRGYRRLAQYRSVYGAQPFYFCYEIFAGSYRYVFERLERAFSLRIDEEARERIRLATSRSANDALRDLHVSSAEPDLEQLIPKALRELLSKVLLRKEIALYASLRATEERDNPHPPPV